MKQRSIILIFAVAVIICRCNETQTLQEPPVNPLLGDISFVNKFGKKPSKETNENLRIKTHLQYVEHLLRRKDVSTLDKNLQEKRLHLLDQLHTYWTNGIFPKNYEFKGSRVPCFIDKQGRICAVGYLIEETAGRELAETINRRHRYHKILSMDDGRVNQWIANSGLTKEECAMIQPTYGWTPEPTIKTSPAYEIGSSLLGGMNIAFNAVNILQIRNGASSPAVGVFSLWTGGASIFLGAWHIHGRADLKNQSQKTISMINIGLGSSAVILGIINLSSNRPRKNKSLAWNIYSLPGSRKKPGIGFSLTKSL
jgi:hypothetical protein